LKPAARRAAGLRQEVEWKMARKTTHEPAKKNGFTSQTGKFMEMKYQKS
jgi:hypothetical protein